MKLRNILCLLPLGLSGCAGYNNTMFMTKSNVGLDFDSKPPTLEVSVSRKEAVIAPSFEGGQTPPVMASFRPHAGTGNAFTSFFMGADQTFAGGDAALAMAMLYDSRTATNKSLYDSAIQLNQAPGYTDCFRSIPGTGKTRPLIFGTDTSLGLKVAWSGVGGQLPDTVKLGFNRKEFAWAPLSATPTNVNAHGQPNSMAVAVKMPAFLATIQSKQGVGTNGTQIEGMQYFATGDSATYLAMQRDVRAAMIARMDPNTEIYKRLFETGREPARLSILTRAMVGVYDALDKLSKPPGKDTIAAAHLVELDKAAANFGIPASFQAKSFIQYNYDDTSKVLTKKAVVGNYNAVQPVQSPFDGAVRYWNDLGASVYASSLAVAAGAAVQFNGQNITQPESDILSAQLQLQKKALDELEQKFNASDAVVDAMSYYGKLVNPK